MTLDDIDRNLLNLLQAEFPLVRQPFVALGERTGTGGPEVLRRIEILKDSGTVRYIGPLFNAASLGYRTTLVGMRIVEPLLNEAARVIGAHEGVSHAYVRDHDWNLWITLALPSERNLDSEAGGLAHAILAEVMINAPAVRAFKLRACFDATASGAAVMPDSYPVRRRSPDEPAELSGLERAVINELQQDIPLTDMPFDSMAERVGVAVEEFLACCRALLDSGVMRRYCASVRHADLGLAGNALVCWAVPPEMVETAGRKLASLREVSHCYERRIDSFWPYNLYAMIHAPTREACWEIVRNVSQQPDLGFYVILFTVRELKKTRVRYPV